MPARLILLSVSLTGVLIAALPSQAHARMRIPMLVTLGDRTTKIADIPAGASIKREYPDAVVSYKYEHVGLFWLPLWTWDGKYCVYSERKRTAVVGTPEEIASLTGVSATRIKKPFTYSCPLLLDILAVFLAAFVLLKVLEHRRAQREEEETARTLAARSPDRIPLGRF